MASSAAFPSRAAAAPIAVAAATRGELLELVRVRSFRRGAFTLASGRTSSLYFNMKPTMMAARGAELCAMALLDIVAALRPRFVGGLEMGAVPVIASLAALSSREGRPVATLFVRKAVKGHGTRDLIEGLGPDDELAGAPVLVVDDVATSGGSILQAVVAIRAAGGVVTDAACLLNRNEGGDELLAAEGVRLHSVLEATQFG